MRMHGKEQIIKIADRKLESAMILFDNLLFEDAYYIAGYHIELLLKARICQIISIDSFFEEKGQWLKKIQFSQTFRTHDIEALLILAGLRPAFDEFLRTEDTENFQESLIYKWSADCRYLPDRNESETGHFLLFVKSLGIWIKEILREG